jgi:hypothetical protein
MFLAEEMYLRTNARTAFLLPWMKQGGFILSARPWTRAFLPPDHTPPDLFVFLHVDARESPWLLKVTIENAQRHTSPVMFEQAFSLETAGRDLMALLNDLLPRLTILLALRREDTEAALDMPPPELLPGYLAGLEQALAVGLAARQQGGADFLHQERSIFDHLFDVALGGAALLRPRHAAGQRAREPGAAPADIVREYLDKLTLLQQQHDLPAGAGSALVAKGVDTGPGKGGAVRRLAICILGLCLAAAAGAQDAIDAKLLADISRIRAIDNHMHGDPVDAARATRWKDDNPLGTPRYPDVVGLQRTNPEWRSAWYALYGYSFSDSELPHLKSLLTTKRETLLRAGVNWPSIVLDAAGVEIALVNTVRPGAGQTSGRFRWVPYADPLAATVRGRRELAAILGGELSIATLLREVGYSRPPPTAHRVSLQHRQRNAGALEEERRRGRSSFCARMRGRSISKWSTRRRRRRSISRPSRAPSR